ncbi:histidine kinase/DNA gyrase B/HSP90-like ATPase [Heliophilum fasciatum]|uniref:histidine kinase n=1 Tax=Heliophilum fasciatum TaxID=35700 RepID=A0A4R2RBZ1_9FIRM|nr:signal transduction histidine kinase [Heliophilum fasciatum]TCP59894.1 histidine kinase/DNA gyrase B/HSP90-like ATPase [Heliophilum fasciatum]
MPDLFYFTVTDTGIGIDRKDQELIFEAFTQVDGTMGRKYEGTGLGLSYAKELVESLDGEIGVISTLGKGATFWFTIPTAKEG